MIPNQWYVVLDSQQVKRKPVGVTRMGEKLVFWRDDSGRVICLRDRCVHRGVQLSKGKIIDGHLQCPFHGFEYDPAGKVTKIPAYGSDATVPERFRVHSYPTYEAFDLIWIWWGPSPPEDLQPPRFFDDIDHSFRVGRAIDPWDVHYSRVVENQLDPVHLPFVHHNTIGRGGRTVVDGPGLKWIDDDLFFAYVYNRVDDGSPVRKPNEVPVPNPTSEYKLEFQFPNLWQNHISNDLRIVAAFVPVDEDHTLLYLRTYQRFLTAPLLGRLVAQLSMIGNLYIARQDRRVVVTQQPKRSALVMGEKLIQGDHPIVAYRKRRQELLDQAAEARSRKPA
jgi:phenylpropionate dioxygenase-like ring-hydroxylating dioxygenase large terminal subunit